MRAADLAGVLTEGHVLGPVHGVFDDPVSAGPGGEFGRGGLRGGQVGDRVDGLGGPLLRPAFAAFAVDPDDVACVREE